ncbi:DUF2975 domain-containing protein [Ruminococcus sp.]|uniref:DUF2975 domain-containing protein n=1 Tax=Ruminococcus sp. TaxID=41978 RepID=UPI002628487E|nr:DUF2975 domain-containing protein [Ruminococcus sp.]MDD7556030.1 DUF2975 domain-containing protein [Ruminococcus sp.]MDY4964445.1 DUF2975 domain-containing protein [Ruminococcus callidus]
MKWTQKASLRLTTIINWVAFATVVFLMFFIPVMARWYDDVSMTPPIFLPLCICLYLSAGQGLVVLLTLGRLLHNLNRDRIFVTQNVTCLRIISWCCFGISLVFLGLAWFRSLGLLVAFAAAFFGLILRVLKNVFARAVTLQEEADYTI